MLQLLHPMSHRCDPWESGLDCQIVIPIPDTQCMVWLPGNGLVSMVHARKYNIDWVFGYLWKSLQFDSDSHFSTQVSQAMQIVLSSWVFTLVWWPVFEDWHHHLKAAAVQFCDGNFAVSWHVSRVRPAKSLHLRTQYEEHLFQKFWGENLGSLRHFQDIVCEFVNCFCCWMFW